MPDQILPPEPKITEPLGGGGEQPNKGVPAGSGGAGGKRGKKYGGLLETSYGTQYMKAYPVTEEQLENLFGIGLLGTVCFATASGLFSFAINVQENLSFSQEIPNDAIIFWTTLRTISFILSIGMFLAGCGFLKHGNNRLKKIKKATKFPTEN